MLVALQPSWQDEMVNKGHQGPGASRAPLESVRESRLELGEVAWWCILIIPELLVEASAGAQEREGVHKRFG